MCERKAIGSRITQERNRLGLTQDQVATQGGVSRRTQMALEKGQTTPDISYLLALSEIGVDWIYVSTGTQEQGWVASRIRWDVMKDLIRGFIDAEIEGRKRLSTEKLELLTQYMYEKEIYQPSAASDRVRQALGLAS